MRPSRLFARVVSLMAVLVVIAACVWLWEARINPARIPQSRLHALGTGTDRAVMTPLPSQHRVVITSVQPADITEAVRSYLPRSVGGVADAEVQGYFDPETGEIHITGALARLEAMSPVPWVQGRFRYALRHEYGHAFLDEWLRRKGDLEGVALVPRITQEGNQGLEDVPERLQPVVSEYRRSDDRIYGSTYFTSYFAEFMAESYARYLVGGKVPPETERLLRSMSRPSPNG